MQIADAITGILKFYFCLSSFRGSFCLGVFLAIVMATHSGSYFNSGSTDERTPRRQTNGKAGLLQPMESVCMMFVQNVGRARWNKGDPLQCLMRSVY